MTLLRTLATLLVLTSLAAGCVGPCAEEPVPPAPISQPPLAPSKPVRIESSSAVAEPEPELAALIRDLHSDDDAVVLAAAKRVEWRSLTNAEMARLVPLLWRALLADPDGDLNWEELRSFVGSAEIPAMVATLPNHMDPGTAEWIAGGLHRMIRSEHLPGIAAKFLEMEDPAYRNAFTWDIFGLPLEYTDRHRELAARTLLRHSMPAGKPKWEEPTASGPGYPALLEAVLRRFVTEDEACPFPNAWIGRWMSAERPGAKDAEVLIALVERANTSQLVQPAERAIGFLSDEDSLAALGASVVAQGALARRGSKATLKCLLGESRTDSDAMAVLFDVAPDFAVAHLTKRILSNTPDTERALLVFQDVLLEQRYWFGTKIEDRWFDGLGDEALRRKLAGHRLAMVGAIVPGCRTREIAERACALLMESPPPAALPASVLSFLEVGAPDAYLAMLRRTAVAKDEDVRAGARWALLRLGDPESADLLIAYVKAEGTGFEDDMFLAESGGPAVEAYLRKTEKDGALAVFHGLPASLHFGFGGEIADPMRKLIRAGRPVDALVHFLTTVPDAAVPGIGRVRDERVRAWLEKQRALRRDVPWATGELMLAGDAAARRETWAALTTGRYRWVDEADTEIMTLDYDLSTIPHWLDDLESNCCRFNVVAGIFEDLFAIDMDAFRNSPVATPARVARDFWERHRGNLVWSRTARCFVPGAR